jgi:hypothetical protein
MLLICDILVTSCLYVWHVHLAYLRCGVLVFDIIVCVSPCGEAVNFPFCVFTCSFLSHCVLTCQEVMDPGYTQVTEEGQVIRSRQDSSLAMAGLKIAVPVLTDDNWPFWKRVKRAALNMKDLLQVALGQEETDGRDGAAAAEAEALQDVYDQLLIDFIRKKTDMAYTTDIPRRQGGSGGGGFDRRRRNKGDPARGSWQEGQTKRQSQMRDKCFECGQQGHIKRDCSELKRQAVFGK